MSDEQKLKDYHALMQAQQEHTFIFVVACLGLVILGVSIFPNYKVAVFIGVGILLTYLNHRFMTTHKCPFCGNNFFLLNRNKDYSDIKTIRNMPMQKVCVNCGEPAKKDKAN